MHPLEKFPGKCHIVLAAYDCPTEKVPVECPSHASTALQAYRNKYGFGASGMKANCGQIYNAANRSVAYVSYNGRVWEGKIGKGGALLAERAPMPGDPVNETVPLVVEKTEPKKIELTEEEKTKLVEIVQRGVKAQCDLWDVLSEIGNRLQLDWEPNGDSSGDIVNNLAAGSDEPEAETILSCFTDPTDWLDVSEFGKPESEQ